MVECLETTKLDVRIFEQVPWSTLVGDPSLVTLRSILNNVDPHWNRGNSGSITPELWFW